VCGGNLLHAPPLVVRGGNLLHAPPLRNLPPPPFICKSISYTLVSMACFFAVFFQPATCVFLPRAVVMGYTQIAPSELKSNIN